MSTTADGVASLVDFSLQSLQTMYQNDAGLFCKYRDRVGRRYGISPRYTLICLIGMYRAKAAGYDVQFDTDAIFKRVLDHAASTPADGGLRLWASALYAPHLGSEFSTVLESQLAAEPRSQRTGMHAGLALLGFVAYAEASGDSVAIKRAGDFRDQIVDNYGKSSSGLFFHLPPATLRRTKPNFATQIYLMHGLTRESVLSRDPLGADIAERCARTLAELQREDGGWPWIYDTSGSVVEDFEIYSVHQDAMAPMAFLALADAGRSGMLPLVDRGLEWLAGQNVLGLEMVDPQSLLIHRSIRRPRPLNRIMLTINAASAAVLNRAPLHAAGKVELNATSRPYHLGWILEAWSGRTAVPSRPQQFRPSPGG